MIMNGWKSILEDIDKVTELKAKGKLERDVDFKIGEKVEMNGIYHVDPEHEDKVFTVSSKPYVVAGVTLVNLKELGRGYAVKGLIKISDYFIDGKIKY